MTPLVVRRLTARVRPLEDPDLVSPARHVRAWLWLQALVYSAAAWAALGAAFAGSRPIVGADLDAHSAFPWLRESVLALGMGLAGLGAILVRRALTDPRDRALPVAPPAIRRVAHQLWHVGGVTRGAMLMVPGILLALEAWTYRRGSFGHVTEQTRQLLQSPGGRLLLVEAALGLAAFALAEVAAAVYRRDVPDADIAASVTGRGRTRPWPAVGGLPAGGIVLWAVLVLVGHLVAALTPADGRGGEGAVDAWLAAHRTPVLDRLSAIGSGLADTMTCITVAGVVTTMFALWLRRRREPLAVVLAIAGEVLVFVLVTAAVHRVRPGVPHLDPAPPTSSFPSGHTGAAVALYGCTALILLREVRRRSVAVTLATVLFAVPVVVALSRLYRGMHYPTDVLAGAAAGGTWLALVILLLLAPTPRVFPPRSTSPSRHLEVIA